MGVRKRETADARKEANKSIAFAKLYIACPQETGSPLWRLPFPLYST